ncbi:MAG: gliding motility lipoprotein GldB [Phocaeicola sp.]|uniref:gliding motility protein GldB-related protein n=1 Tax=Phocaeicola sp. TaxID=2773926 RepID=UPI003F9EBC58
MRKMLILILSVFVFTSCDWSGRTNGHENNSKVTIERYDRLQFESVTMNNVASLQKMNTDYPQATKLLIEDVLSIGDVSDPEIDNALLSFFSDTIARKLMNDVENKYQDVSGIEKELSKGFLNIRKDLNFFPIPRIYTQISGLNQSIVVGDSLVGISLDKYMGIDYPLYKRYYYDMQSRFMDLKRIVPDFFYYYLLSQYELPFNFGRTLLDVIMHRGKVHWLIKKALDYDSIEEELGYNKEEEKWCKKNKRALWKFVQEHDHLNATDPMIVRSYMNYPYFTIINDENTPYSIGIYLGYQLIDQFMNSHRNVSVKELMERTDYRKMLQDTKVSF